MTERGGTRRLWGPGGIVVAVVVLALVSVVPGSGGPAVGGAHSAGTASSLSWTASAAGVSVNLSGGAPRPLAPAFFGTDVRVDAPFQSTQVNELNRTVVRYVVWPGGAIADRYDAVANKLYSTSGQVSTPSSNEAQFVAGCRAIGCHVILQVPAEIDEPSVGAAMINYTIHNLSFTPDYIEIGNEPALWTHFGTPWSQWGSGTSGNATPATYAKVVQQYILAIRAVDPTAKFVGLPGVGQGASPEPSWLSATVKLNGPNLSAVGVHVYPGGSNSPSSPTLSQFFAQLSGSASLPVRIPKDRAAMAAACSGCGSLSILVTELGASGSATSFSSFMAGFPNVPYITTELIQGMELNLSSLDDFAFQNSYPGSWYASNGTQKPVYTLYQQILPLVGSEFVPVVLSPSTAALSVALLEDPANGSEALLVANTNTTAARTLDLSGLGLTGNAGLTWWNASAVSPSTVRASTVPTVFAVAPESIGLLSASGGSAPPPPPPSATNGTLQGTVAANATGAPVVGAGVVATSGTGSLGATTNASGGYRLSLPVGSYGVLVTAPGFAPSGTDVTVTSGNVTVLDFLLFANATAAYFPVSGLVVDAHGLPLAGAVVSAGTSTSAVTSANGSFSLAVPNGTYSLTIVCSGYQSSSWNVTVSGSAVNEGAIRLLSAAQAQGNPHFTLQGYVYDSATGALVPSARVFVSNGSATQAVPVTSHGIWSVSLPNGSYTFLATASGYGSDQVQVRIAGAPSGPVALQLDPSNVSTSSTASTPGTEVPPMIGALLPFLPSAGVGVLGFVSWRRFLRGRSA